MSNMRKCAKGHEYNGDQYAACPFCNRSRAQMVFEGAGKTVFPGAEPIQHQGPLGQVGKTVPVADHVQHQDPLGQVGKTVIPEEERQKMQTPADSDVGKTVWETKKRNKYDPVVAWLVCVDGEDKGKSFNLHSGVNFIGRDDSNDISFPYGNISRKNHVKIAYDSKYNTYRLIPGDSHDIVYCNSNGLYESIALKAYDEIEIGDLKLLFIPFCGEQFQWKE